ncbi:MAG: DUF2336 domain-containing protein [Pirellulaceae bacterium]|nr:DUF2336 domain-containing protein [Pirellulaceae bacterium]
MSSFDENALLAGKDDVARCGIAHRAGEWLTNDGRDLAGRQAAEALARALAADASERVRYELSLAVRQTKFLPRDIALKIAHDIDSVACPFLEVTEVFSEEDWRQLVLTISRTALLSVARRASMPETLAVAVAEIGDTEVAETLVGNKAAPMTEPVCSKIISRFGTVQSVLTKMAGRDDLVAEVVVALTNKITGAVREKMFKRYNMPDRTEAIGAEAATNALLALVRDTPDDGLAALVQSLSKEGKLADLLLLRAICAGHLRFVATAIATRIKSDSEHVEHILRHSSLRNVAELFTVAHIPKVLHADFWTAISSIRTSTVSAANS